MDVKLREPVLRLAAMLIVLIVGLLLALALNSLWILAAAIIGSIVMPRLVVFWRRRRTGSNVP